MKIIQLAHRTVDELLEEIFAITSKQEIDTNDRRVLYAVACAMKNRYENDVPKWIPVSERLPEKGGEYLVSVHHTIGAISVFHPEKDTYVDDVAIMKYYGKFPSTVRAWMPLPAPYQKGAKD